MSSLADYRRRLRAAVPAGISGTVVETIGMTIAVAGLPAPIGASVVVDRSGSDPLSAEVIGFRDDWTLLFPLDHVRGVRRGDRVRLVRTAHDVPVGHGLLGRVVNALGHAIDGAPAPVRTERADLDADPPLATERPPIGRVFTTGIRAIDTLLTCGEGQRLGIFSAAGVGKSMTLGMLARHAQVDYNVIALIGERGREVNEFVTQQLSDEARQRTVIVVATSDQPAILRVRAALAATTIAEYFRGRGNRVLLLMDSLTRFAVAAREIAVAAGEPPAARGFPPSVFAQLPRLMERSGCSREGSITSFYTVLVDGEDQEDPVAEAVRGYLDGHIVLSRKLAAAGHYPAIDVLGSISRVMRSLIDEPQRHAAEMIRRQLAIYAQHEELISLGAYRAGSNPALDRALANYPAILSFLKQDASISIEWRDSLKELRNIASMEG